MLRSPTARATLLATLSAVAGSAGGRSLSAADLASLRGACAAGIRALAAGVLPASEPITAPTGAPECAAVVRRSAADAAAIRPSAARPRGALSAGLRR